MFERLTLSSWWSELSENWRGIFIRNLGLEGLFSEKDLVYLNALTELDCSATTIDDLSPLVYLPQIESLNISDTSIRNFAPLKHLTSLRELHASFCYGIDLSILSDLKNLRVLDISYPKSTHRGWPGLESLENLTEFYGNACGIGNLAPFLNLGQLQLLSLHFNYIAEGELVRLERELSCCRIMG